jgi:hypothetical protein
MKKTLLTIIAIASFTLANAQSLSHSGLLITPSVFDPTTLVANLTVTNNTNGPLNVMCQRTVENLTSGHHSSFCWDQCYPDFVSISDFPITIAANGSSTAFVGDLLTAGIAGMSDVTYSFFVDGNPNDQTTVTIQYNYTTGISNVITETASISSARPNPADAFTTVSYNLKGNYNAYTLELNSLLGAKVAQLNFNNNNGVLNIPTQNLNAGVYFYTLKENGKTLSSQKLIVSHK